MIPTPITAETRFSTGLKRRLAAAGLSTLVPGAGQLFLGKRRKAVILFLIFVAVAIGFWPLRLPNLYPGLLLLAWVCLLLSGFSICDALLIRGERSPHGLSKWWLLTAAPLTYVGTNLIFTSLLLVSGFRALRFESSSMEPTIQQHERFVFDAKYYRSQPKQRRDLVVLRRQGFYTVKRIIALAGDTLQGKERQISLNGNIQNEPFIQHEFPVGNDPQLDTFGPVTVQTGKYFVMGDNRDVSLDSRMPDFGLVDSQAIVGRPLYTYRFRSPFSKMLN